MNRDMDRHLQENLERMRSFASYIVEVSIGNGEMRYSQRAIDLIKGFESLSLTKYKCSGEKDTIGWGHVILKGEDIPDKITVEKAEELLKQDVKKADDALKLLLSQSAPFTQNQYDALVSLVFNWGIRNFAESRCLKALNVGNTKQAVIEWREVIKTNGQISQGLINRRKKEIELFKGNYE